MCRITTQLISLFKIILFWKQTGIQYWGPKIVTIPRNSVEIIIPHFLRASVSARQRGCHNLHRAEMRSGNEPFEAKSPVQNWGQNRADEKQEEEIFSRGGKIAIRGGKVIQQWRPHVRQPPGKATNLCKFCTIEKLKKPNLQKYSALHPALHGAKNLEYFYVLRWFICILKNRLSLTGNPFLESTSRKRY